MSKTRPSIVSNTFKLRVACASLLLLGSVVAEASTITLSAVNSGWYKLDGTSNGLLGNIVISNDGSNDYRNWLGFDLSSISNTITSATLEVGSNSQNSSGQLIIWSDVSTSYGSLGTSSTAIYNDLGSGSQFSAGVHTAGAVNSFSLNADGLISLNAASSLWAIGGQHNDADNAFAFAFTQGILSGDHMKLVLEVSAIPLPAAVWLFGSGLLGLVCVARRKIS